MQGAAAMAGGVREDQVAVASTGVIGVLLDAGDIIRGIARARGDLREYGHGDFSEAIQTTDKFAKEVEVDVALPSGTVRLTAQAKGAGMISPELRDDAVLRADRRGAGSGVRRSAARPVRRAVVRSHQRGRAALHQRHRDLPGVAARSGVSVVADSEDAMRFGEALDWALRKLALDIVRDGEGSKRIGRVVVRGGSDNVVETAARAIANSPLVKAALHGGDPNWGRIAQAVGGGDADTAPLALDIFIENVQVCAAGMAIPLRRRRAGRGGRRATRSSTTSCCPGERRRDRGLLLRPLARVRDHQRGLHDVMRDVGTLLEALPYIREFHGKTVVIKYGGAAMTDPALREEFARDVVILKYVGLNPIIVHGGGPDITAYMKRLDMPVEFIGGLRVSDADTVEIAKMVLVGKVNKDIVSRINRHGQPAVGLSGDDGQLFRVSTMVGPGRRGHRLRGQDRARRHRRDQPHRRGLHPGHRVGRRGPGRALAQRQRRRGRGRDRPRPGRLQGDLPHGRGRAGCAIRPTRRA